MGLKINTIEFDGLTADPISPPNGCLWYRSDQNKWYMRRNSATEEVMALADRKATFQVMGARNSNLSFGADMRYGDGVAFNEGVFVIPYDCELKYITASSNGVATWQAHVYKNGSSVTNLGLSSEDSKVSSELSITFSAGDKLRLRADNITGNVPKPTIRAFFKEL